VKQTKNKQKNKKQKIQNLLSLVFLLCHCLLPSGKSVLSSSFSRISFKRKKEKRKIIEKNQEQTR